MLTELQDKITREVLDGRNRGKRFAQPFSDEPVERVFLQLNEVGDVEHRWDLRERQALLGTSGGVAVADLQSLDDALRLGQRLKRGPRIGQPRKTCNGPRRTRARNAARKNGCAALSSRFC